MKQEFTNVLLVNFTVQGQLPDYQRLKASRYYEENKESLQYVDMALKAIAVLV